MSIVSDVGSPSFFNFFGAIASTSPPAHWTSQWPEGNDRIMTPYTLFLTLLFPRGGGSTSSDVMEQHEETSEPIRNKAGMLSFFMAQWSFLWSPFGAKYFYTRTYARRLPSLSPRSRFHLKKYFGDLPSRNRGLTNPNSFFIYATHCVMGIISSWLERADSL